MDYKLMDGAFIIEWCKKNNQVDWLKKAYAKYGKNFLMLKRAFALEFMADIVPKAKPKEKGFFELVDEL